ncbi:hypothetical protein U1Q18_005575, partial [Sarracenia purpurea var. burkii]
PLSSGAWTGLFDLSKSLSVGEVVAFSSGAWSSLGFYCFNAEPFKYSALNGFTYRATSSSERSSIIQRTAFSHEKQRAHDEKKQD